MCNCIPPGVGQEICIVVIWTYLFLCGLNHICRVGTDQSNMCCSEVEKKNNLCTIFKTLNTPNIYSGRWFGVQACDCTVDPHLINMLNKSLGISYMLENFDSMPVNSTLFAFLFLSLSLYLLPTAPHYRMLPLLLLSLPTRLFPSCSKEAYQLFPWKQQLIATGGNHCGLIITYRPKKLSILKICYFKSDFFISTQIIVAVCVCVFERGRTFRRVPMKWLVCIDFVQDVCVMWVERGIAWVQ